MSPSINASTYNIELRDKDGNLKTYLTPFVTKLSWSWSRLGGCDIASFRISKNYRDIEFEADDDIQIWLDGGKLVWRGFIYKVIPKLSVDQTISVEARGYFYKLRNLIVHNEGSTKTYIDTLSSDVVDDIVDTFITPNSSITKGTIDSGSFVSDILEFKGNVADALETLATLEGDIEYGVDEDLVFFWRTENINTTYKFFVGNNVEKFERTLDWSKLLNKIYFEGGELNGVALLKVAEAPDSQNKYFISEDIISNSSIVSSSTADQYLTQLLKRRSSPTYVITASIPNTNKRLEDTIPIGKVSIVDSDYDEGFKIWGTTANGGSNIIWGRTKNGGSNRKWGSSFSQQIKAIFYTPSETLGRFNIELSFGDTTLDTVARIKQIETTLSAVRQRGL